MIIDDWEKTMKIAKRVETEWAVLELTESGVLVFRYFKGVELSETVARTVVAAGVELCGDLVPTPVLALLDEINGFTRGAQKFFAESEENQAASARVALVVSSPIAKVIANFFMKLNKPRVPTRMFTDQAKAMTWLTRS